MRPHPVVNAPKLVIVDLDGTVLNRHGEISPRTAAAFNKAKSAGVWWTPATSRGAGKLQFPGLTGEGDLPWIAAGGALIVRPHPDGTVERLHEQPISTRVIAVAVAAAHARLGRDLVVGVDRHLTLAAGPGYPPSPGRAHRRDLRHLAQLWEEPCDMMRIWHPHAADLLTDGLPGVELWDVGRPGYLEATAAGTNKADTAAKLAADYGVAVEDVWAIGDGANDVGMLQWAGTGVAMRNAVPELAAVADATTIHDHDHDGLAQLLETVLA